MKKIFLILIVLLLSGCTTDYNLEINNNSFKENIDVIIDKDLIPQKTLENVEVDDQITPFIKGDYSALFSKESFYDKKVDYFDDYMKVNMNYKYDDNSFGDSSILNLCFSGYEFGKKNNYYIHAYGEFNCLYSENLNINIKTNNKVIKNNADEVNGNIYTWHINSNNVDNVNIEIEIEKGISSSFIIIVITGIILIIGIGFIIYTWNKKNKENNQI